MEYTYQPYPRWKFHRTKPAVIVNDPAEEEALGPGWYDTYAIPAEPEKPVRKRKE